MNSEGKLTWKNDLWRDVRNVILPGVAQKVGHVPIPRIEYTDNQLDLVIENLTLQGKNLFPKYVKNSPLYWCSFPYEVIASSNLSAKRTSGCRHTRRSRTRWIHQLP